MAKLKDILNGKTPKERATLKGREIAKLQLAGEHARAKSLRIEIQEVVAVEGGVEVLARAWKGNKQIGFGEDGSVDIERFRIFNPPILVSDENGDILQEWVRTTTDGEEIHESRRLREDAGEALLQVIEHNISVMKNVHVGSKNIEEGKVGRTTSTFYPSAGDGIVGKGFSSNFSTERNAGTGSMVDYTGVSNEYGSRSSGSSKYVKRGYFPIDTSSIPDSDNISSATLTVTSSAANANTGTFYVTPQTQSSTSSLSTGDYSAVTLNSTPTWSSGVAPGSLSVGSKVNFALNSTGLAAINKTGFTKFGMRDNNDINNVDGQAEVQLIPYFSEQSGTTDDPVLVVEHAAPSVPVTVNAAVQVATFSIPAYTVSAGATKEATTLAATFNLIAPTVSATSGVTVPVSTLSATFSLPLYDVEAGDVGVSASTLSATFSIPAYTVVAEIWVSVPATTLSATFSIPSYSVEINAGGAPSTLGATFSLIPYTVSVTANPTIAATPLTLTFSVPSYGIEQGVTVLAQPLVLTFSIPTVAVDVVAHIVVLVNTLALTFTTPTRSYVGSLWRKQPQAIDEWSKMPLGE